MLAIVLKPFDQSKQVVFDIPPEPFGMTTLGPELSYTIPGDLISLYFAESTFITRPNDKFPVDVEPFNATISLPPEPFGATTLGPDAALTESLHFPRSGLQLDTPADSLYFEPRLLQSFNFENRLWQGDEPSGRSRPGFGVIEISNADGAYDDVLSLGWNGHELRVYEGEANEAFANWRLVFIGRIQNVEWDNKSIRVTIKDPQERLERPLQQRLYLGTGGKEGGSDIKGQPKPLAFGQVYNIPATRVDPIKGIFQLHDGPIQSVDAVRDKGILLSPRSDFPTYEALEAATTGAVYSGADIEAGEYATCLAEGFIRLGSTPAGRITADIHGDATGGYVDTTAAIIRRIATTRLGAGYNFNYPSEFDTTSFTVMDLIHGGAIGYFTNSVITAGAVFDELMHALASVWGVTLLGQLTLQHIELSSGTPKVTLKPHQLGPVFSRLGPVPCWRRRLGYKPVWHVQGADELADAVSETDRAFYGQAYRYVTNERPEIRDQHRNARDVTLPGFFVNESDAEEEVQMQANLFTALRSIYRVQVDVDSFAADLNEIIAIEGYTRFGFSSPQQFRLFGHQVDRKLGVVTYELLV